MLAELKEPSSKGQRGDLAQSLAARVWSMEQCMRVFPWVFLNWLIVSNHYPGSRWMFRCNDKMFDMIICYSFDYIDWCMFWFHWIFYDIMIFLFINTFISIHTWQLCILSGQWLMPKFRFENNQHSLFVDIVIVHSASALVSFCWSRNPSPPWHGRTLGSSPDSSSITSTRRLWWAKRKQPICLPFAYHRIKGIRYIYIYICTSTI